MTGWTHIRLGRGFGISLPGIGIAVGIAAAGALFEFLLLALSMLVIVCLLFYGLMGQYTRRAALDAARIDPETVKVIGMRTEPRTWGVYRVIRSRKDGVHTYSAYHFGNHPVRQRELEKRFGDAELVGLFASRIDAEQYSILRTQER